MGKYFGTDGIRGPVGGDLINADVAYRLGSALGRYLKALKPELPLNAVIGRDTRSSGAELADALIRGLNQHGVYVHDLGIVPTPSIAQSVLEQQADLGIAVTASQIPPRIMASNCSTVMPVNLTMPKRLASKRCWMPSLRFLRICRWLSPILWMRRLFM